MFQYLKNKSLILKLGKVTRAADLKLRLLESSRKQMMTWDKLLSHELDGTTMGSTSTHDLGAQLPRIPVCSALHVPPLYLHHFLIFRFFFSFRTSWVMSFLFLSISALLLYSSFIHSCALFFTFAPSTNFSDLYIISKNMWDANQEIHCIASTMESQSWPHPLRIATSISWNPLDWFSLALGLGFTPFYSLWLTIFCFLL